MLDIIDIVFLVPISLRTLAIKAEKSISPLLIADCIEYSKFLKTYLFDFLEDVFKYLVKIKDSILKRSTILILKNVGTQFLL